MGYYDADVYYQPEKFGLEKIGEIRDPEACYSFNTLAVWKHTDNSVYWATDSGCSCPGEFERYTSLESLNKIETRQDFLDFFQAVTDHCVPYDYEDTYGRSAYVRQYDKDTQRADKTELIAKVSRLVLY